LAVTSKFVKVVQVLSFAYTSLTVIFLMFIGHTCVLGACQ